MCGAECWKDHHLIVSKFKFHIQPKSRPQGKKAPNCLNFRKLKISDNKESFFNTLEAHLESTVLNDHDVEVAWASLCKTVYTIATEFLGPTVRKHNDWFDENCTEIQQLLEEKHHAYRAHIDDPKSTAKKDALRNIRRNMQSSLHQMQDTWQGNKADEIQGFPDSPHKNNFYAGLKEVCGPTTSGTSPLLSTDGSILITDKEKLFERWAKHFNSALNHPSVSNENAIDRLPQVPIDETLDAVPTLKGSRRQYVSYTLAKHLAQMPFQLQSTKTAAWLWWRNSSSSSHLYGTMRQLQKTSKMHLSCTFTNVKKTARPETTTGKSPCFQLQARSWPESC